MRIGGNGRFESSFLSLAPPALHAFRTVPLCRLAEVCPIFASCALFLAAVPDQLRTVRTAGGVTGAVSVYTTYRPAQPISHDA